MGKHYEINASKVKQLIMNFLTLKECFFEFHRQKLLLIQQGNIIFDETKPERLIDDTHFGAVIYYVPISKCKIVED